MLPPSGSPKYEGSHAVPGKNQTGKTDPLKMVRRPAISTLHISFKREKEKKTNEFHILYFSLPPQGIAKGSTRSANRPEIQ